MQFTTSILALAGVFAMTASAAPAASLNPEIIARANSKLNQYTNADCLDNQGNNVPSYHASPPARKCYNIDSTTVSFYFGLGPLSQTWAYAEAGCGGLSVNLGGNGGCQAVEANFSDRFGTIRSVMMD
ncbi:hypothetical protein P153DRAFT_361584 [Dothidotthia symphoricarpi CBS 119687]|uniref:Small secreted protein n=1 Tax=Dothidotthia symphoricarpi CBS 119687 TaxID=1392245 RepID=A0A6A5ZYJ6_9PLEO|nr:uncharacterized protein P153DRAFT_361584 [Dothidotthia symphoricarpi CBS 119687]KAF2123953.1 hypothetical protein P153DRAFT_361584 [Dothidotthia symphoricarpi CBS 119687]